MVGLAGQDTLREELQTYEAQKRGLLARGEDGKFVLIHGSRIGGVFASREEGLAAGYESFGSATFLVREIRAQPRTWRAHPICLKPS